MGRYLLAGLVIFLAFPGIGALAADEGAQLTDRPDLRDQPIRIKIMVLLLDLDDIDGMTQTFTANMYLEMRWKDPRLVREDGRAYRRKLDEIWNPRIQIVNQQKLFKTFPEVADIRPNGTVIYRQRYWGKFSNPLELSDFPFDSQHFRIQLAAAGYDPKEIQFVRFDPDKLGKGMADKLSIADWRITNWDSRPETYRVVAHETGSAGFVYEFRAERLVGYYVIKVFLPLIMIILMSWIVFWIDPSQSASQISVAVTSMLTLIAYRFLLGNLLPRISYLTKMDYFLLGSTFLVFAALIEVAVTSRLARTGRESLANGIDRWCRAVFPISFVVFVMVVLCV